MVWYDTIAPSYEELYGDEQKYKHMIILRKLLNKLVRTNPQEGAFKLVDLGCGSGLLMESLRTNESLLQGDLINHLYYIGLDLSLSLLEYARKRIRHLSWPADVIAGDIGRVPLRDNSSDLTLAITVLRCHDPLSILIRELERISGEKALTAYTILCSDESLLERIMNTFKEAEALTGRETLIISRGIKSNDECLED